MNYNNKPNIFQSMGLAATTSLIAVNFTHPIETVKIRLQVNKNFNLRNFIHNEGISSFWKGIQAAWFREIAYTSIKLGGYMPIREALGASDVNSPFFYKFLAGGISGSLGSLSGNPFDVMKTQMMANSKENKNVLELSKDILKNQGINGFYRGVQANVMRAIVLNGTKMACYDKFKGMIVDKTGLSRKDVRTQFSSAIFAGFFMTCTVSPFDMIRTRLMNQPLEKKIYNGFIDCGTKIAKNEGIKTFYKGFFPIWGRFAPQATLQLIIMDNLLNLYGFKTI